MPLTLYTLDRSPPSRSVDLVIHALGLTAHHKNVNLTEKEHLSPDFLKVNPLHTIPAIDDDGFVLWESRAIMTYLVSKYGKDNTLYPKDLQKRAIVDQRLHYSNDVFYVTKTITRSILYFNATHVPQDSVDKVYQVQQNIEKLLEGHKFIAGDSLTVADYSFITIVDILEVYSPPGDQFPLTSQWMERCRREMKDFDTVNQPGADALISFIKQRLSQ